MASLSSCTILNPRGAESYLQLAKEVINHDKTSPGKGLSTLLKDREGTSDQELLELDVDLLEPNRYPAPGLFRKTSWRSWHSRSKHTGSFNLLWPAATAIAIRSLQVSGDGGRPSGSECSRCRSWSR